MRSSEDETELNALDRVLVTKLDVLDEATIESAVAACIEELGQIVVLLNNACYGAYGRLEAIDMDGIKRQFGTNVIAIVQRLRRRQRKPRSAQKVRHYDSSIPTKRRPTGRLRSAKIQWVFCQTRSAWLYDAVAIRCLIWNQRYRVSTHHRFSSPVLSVARVYRA